MKKLIFKLSDLEFIEMVADYDLEFKKMDLCCDNVKVYFINEQSLRIGQRSAGLLFEAFIQRLKKALDNDLRLNEAIIQNLGFMYNEYYHKLPRKNPKFVMVQTPDGSSKYWIGLNYKVWGTFNDANPFVTTWMYNNDDGNIILEVTPFYKWSMQEDEPENRDFVTYDEFMKDYKPLIHRVIPRDIAIQWLEQAMKIYRGFFTSEEDYIRACKENNW